jgi:hypothetical protein
MTGRYGSGLYFALNTIVLLLGIVLLLIKELSITESIIQVS